jgi:glutathione-specific gamma-glutamylcyclotransferase
MADLWVFGYGSLMWRPGFVYERAVKARLSGFHRSLCVVSHVHRGTPEKPGLVLGLDRGGSCLGIAFLVRGEHRAETIAYLRGRELVTHVYHETVRPIRLEHGEAAQALTYVVDRRHVQYGGRKPTVEAAEIVRHAHGASGPNIDYVVNTVAHLKTLGIRDHGLEDIVRRLGG